uniref:Dirigent protein n=1 Tax=Oryza glumipatula TaxID=40148 RepID=A0A0E0BG11_9ORYZ
MAASPAFLVLAVLLCAAAAVARAADDGAAGMTKFKVYFHDVVGGTKPTAIRVAQAASTNGSSTFFGAVFAIDDPLTTDAASSSSEVGRAQGSYTFADQKTFGLLMNMNFVFTAGDHKGSTLAIVGRNEVLSAVREMSIVGGSGKFRMARGYVEARTVDSGANSGETIVEYTVFVKAA